MVALKSEFVCLRQKWRLIGLEKLFQKIKVKSQILVEGVVKASKSF